MFRSHSKVAFAFLLGWIVCIPSFISTPGAGAAGPERPTARPAELIVCLRALPSSDETAGGVSTAGAAQAVLAVRSAATIAADPQRPASLRALDQKFGLREGKPLFPPTARKPQAGAAPTAPTAPTDEHGLARTGTDANGLNNRAAHGAGAGPSSSPGSSSTYLLRFNPAVDLEAARKAYAADPNVLYAEPNWEGALCYVPTDPLYGETASDLAIIGIEDAWAVQSGAGVSPAVVVAVIDSGVEPYHPDLAPALDLANSWNFTDGNANVFDDLGHGTRVAGIIGAAGNNAEGIAGVAFGCTLLSLDVTTSAGVVTTADVASAINWAVARGADVVNMSLRFSGASQTLQNACDSAAVAGVLLVAAAGNENQGDLPVYPASYDSVIGVGAVMDDGAARAPFSNYNNLQKNLVELVAPGSTVFSTIPGSQYNGTYGSGTSFAAPMVSGVAALLMAHYPGQSAGAIRAHLDATCKRVGQAFQPANSAGAGLLDAKAALETPMTPEISVVSVTVDDNTAYDPDNDGDGILDPDESVKLVLSLTSEKTVGTNVTASLSTANPSIGPISHSTVSFGTVEHGPVTSNTADPFATITVSASAASQPVVFSLALTGDNGYSETITFPLQIENTYTPPTIIGTNTTWTADKSYLIEALTVVMPGATLTVQPGTTLRFGGAGKLEVRGAIEAQGLPDRRITFTSRGSNRGRGGWFDPEIRLQLGAEPMSVAVGDVDGDGNSDIVIATFSSSFLMRWNGNGFDPKIPAGSMPCLSIAIGDVNNDGHKEIVTANYTSNDVSVIRWNGSGFDPEVRLAVGIDPEWVTLGDADNDGDSDILTANLGSNDLSLIRRDGGGFAPEIRFTAGQNPRAVAVGDADNDGNNEIVTANTYSDDVSLIHWNGAGFDPQVRMAAGSRPVALAIGDLDNDGYNDIVTANKNSGNVSLIRWNGTGFDPHLEMATGSTPESVVIGDANNDGYTDILTANRAPQSPNYDYLSVIFWNGASFDPHFDVSAGSGPIACAVGDLDKDGDNDIVVANNWSHDLSLIRWNSALSPPLPTSSRHGGVWIRSTASAAMFSNCDVHFGPVLDESAVGSYSDCLFDRSGGDYSLSTQLGSALLTRCTVRGNGGGDGIRAGSKTLVDCVAEDNAGVGLQGGSLAGCVSRRNGNGMSGTSATNCSSEDNREDGISVSSVAAGCLTTGNGGWGILASGDVQNTTATLNGNGISGSNVTSCAARQNTGVGIQTGGTATRCVAENNGGAGIAGNSLTDCTVVGNASGPSISGTALRCAVAQNAGNGISGGTVDSCSVHHNTGTGASSPGFVGNSWVVGNLAIGVLGKSTSPYSVITNSTIRDNTGSGLKNSGTMMGCNLWGNGGVSGYDYEERRLSTELAQVDLSGNHWGPATTPIMTAHPWGTYYNIPRIYDFVDNTSICEVKYAGHLTSLAAASPDTTPPAFLLEVTPDAANSVNVGWALFTLTFSKEMEANPSSASTLAVSFGLSAPYTNHVVQPAPGWLPDGKTWRGVFSVQSDTGDGVNTIRVANARGADGFLIPDDTAHTFVIDTTGGGAANNGLAKALGSTAMNVSWTDTGKPAGALGFNVRRSASGTPGTYQKITAAAVTAVSYDDAGLHGGTTYFYIVDVVDANNNSTQWTPPFYGKTGGSPFPAQTKEWTLYE